MPWWFLRPGQPRSCWGWRREAETAHPPRLCLGCDGAHECEQSQWMPAVPTKETSGWALGQAIGGIHAHLG